MRVAVVQQAPHGDAVATEAHQISLIERAVDRGARLVVLPEGALTGLALRHAEALAVAQHLDGPYVAAIAAASARLGVAVVVNLYEAALEERRPVAFNTSVVVDRGELVASYRKIHLFDAQGYRESAVVEPGDAVQAQATPHRIDGVAVSVMTCFDLRFAEQAVAAARRGAELLVVPSAWVAGPDKRSQWDVLLRARAVETSSYVAGAAQPGPVYAGGSAIYDPSGGAASDVLDDRHEGIASAEVDPAVVARARASTPTLRHRPVWDAR